MMENQTQVKNSIGQTITILREAKGITQQELADNCEVSNVYISNIENGKKLPSVKLRNRIANALDVTDLEFEASMIVFSGLPIEAKKFTPEQLEYLMTLQSLVSKMFKKYDSEVTSN